MSTVIVDLRSHIGRLETEMDAPYTQTAHSEASLTKDLARLIKSLDENKVHNIGVARGDALKKAKFRTLDYLDRGVHLTLVANSKRGQKGQSRKRKGGGESQVVEGEGFEGLEDGEGLEDVDRVEDADEVEDAEDAPGEMEVDAETQSQEEFEDEADFDFTMDLYEF
jgi:hypothetical protein